MRMRWHLSHRFDPRALVLADQHYSRQTVGSNQFVRPGKCVVLLTKCERTLWVSSWQKPEYEHHAWPGMWQCVVFRNQGAGLSSALIRQAVAATRFVWGEPPVMDGIGMITFVDADRTRPKLHPGRCFREAGWIEIGATGSKKIVFGLPRTEMVDARRPRQMTVSGLPLFTPTRESGARLQPVSVVALIGGLHHQVSSNTPDRSDASDNGEGTGPCLSQVSGYPKGLTA